jgi:hypothetical protein
MRTVALPFDTMALPFTRFFNASKPYHYSGGDIKPTFRYGRHRAGLVICEIPLAALD